MPRITCYNFYIYTKRGFAGIYLVITAAVILALGAAGYFLTSQKAVESDTVSEPSVQVAELENGALPVSSSVPKETDSRAGWLTYVNERYGFELQFPPEIAPFESNIIQLINDGYNCLVRDHDEAGAAYVGSEYTIEREVYEARNATCAPADETFSKYAAKLPWIDNFILESRQVPHPDTHMWLTHRQIPKRDIHTGVTTSHDEYQVLVETKKYPGKRAVHIFFNGGSYSCGNAICQLGENRESCPADCRNYDFSSVLNTIFATFEWRRGVSSQGHDSKDCPEGGAAESCEN